MGQSANQSKRSFCLSSSIFFEVNFETVIFGTSASDLFIFHKSLKTLLIFFALVIVVFFLALINNLFKQFMQVYIGDFYKKVLVSVSTKSCKNTLHRMPKISNPDFSYKNLHMEWYYFCQQFKYYFMITRAKKHKYIFFATFFSKIVSLIVNNNIKPRPNTTKLHFYLKKNLNYF